ncbi:hypothetical protein [Sphingobacterium sp. MYb382]|uniref:hypothetical protein n=1 Tax=Sphingobacterium sp. MYb382 TaxID=2745278 RepID=UPI00309DBCE6
MYTLSAHFSEYLNELKSKQGIAHYLQDIVDLLVVEGTVVQDIDKVLGRYAIQDFDTIKIESIDLLIDYANYILEDSVICDQEALDFEILKKVFRIREGEFLQHRSFQVNEILKKEFIRIYSDNFVDQKEELEKVNLQALFNLSYDQFEEIKQDEVIKALLHGANPEDLSIATIPKGFRV